jgi:hypothetical protein
VAPPATVATRNRPLFFCLAPATLAAGGNNLLLFAHAATFAATAAFFRFTASLFACSALFAFEHSHLLPPLLVYCRNFSELPFFPYQVKYPLHSPRLFRIQPVLRVHPETSSFVCVQGARKTKKRSVHPYVTILLGMLPTVSRRAKITSTFQVHERHKGP